MTKKTDEELDDLELEMRRLTLIKLRYDVEKETQRRADVARVSQSQEQSLREARKNVETRQKACPHKKGGKNIEGINNGKDPYYSIFIHTYATGEVVPMCTRCHKEWHRPAPALRVSDPERYAEEAQEYIAALQFPTDNEPSGTQLFTVVPNSDLMHAG